MTHTDPTAKGLLARILATPAEDTPRLVYADWLDDNAGTVPCSAHGCKSGQVYAMRQCRDGIMRNAWDDCPTCHGTGTVSDGFAERAELIRVQVGLARNGYLSDGEPCPCQACEEKRARADELLTDARRREWFGIPCPVCDGAMPVSMRVDCPVCDETRFAPCDAHRGFVYRVRCRMGDVLEYKRFVRRREPSPISFLREPESGPIPPPPPLEEYYEWALTLWAAGVLAAHPVTEWEAGFQPLVYIGEGQVAFESGDLPAPVFAELKNDPRAKGFGNVFDGETVATDALALAVGRVARRLAELPEVTP